MNEWKNSEERCISLTRGEWECIKNVAELRGNRAALKMKERIDKQQKPEVIAFWKENVAFWDHLYDKMDA